MKKIRIVLVLGVIISIFVIWYSTKAPETLMTFVTKKIPVTTESIDLIVGGNFQYSEYHFENGPSASLTYKRTIDGNSIENKTKFSEEDVTQLDLILGKYEIASMKSDGLAGPDMSNFTLKISRGNEKYELYCVTSVNSCTKLSEELKKLFISQTP